MKHLAALRMPFLEAEQAADLRRSQQMEGILQGRSSLGSGHLAGRIVKGGSSTNRHSRLIDVI